MAVVSPVHASADNPNPLVELVDAAAQRLQTADPVAAFKWVSNGSVNDPARVQQVLAAVTADATANRIDADYVERVFTDQIDATEAVEYSRFAQWKLDPAGAPTVAPDLSASRSTIDALNRRMVGEIASQWDLLHSPSCRSEIDDANNAVTDARRLDALYRQTLSFASRSYCG
jgi:chorismate mutase